MTFPNQLSVLRMILTPLFASFFLLGSKYLSFGLFFLASLTDWYDGYHARKYGSISSTGKYLDPLADKLMVLTAFGVFMYNGIIPFWMFILIVIRDVVITSIRWYAHAKKKPIETSNFAKWKTACQVFAIYLIYITNVSNLLFEENSLAQTVLTALERWNAIYQMMFFVTLYTLASGLSYLYDNRSHLKSIAIAFYRVFVPTNVR